MIKENPKILNRVEKKRGKWRDRATISIFARCFLVPNQINGVFEGFNWSRCEDIRSARELIAER